MDPSPGEAYHPYRSINGHVEKRSELSSVHFQGNTDQGGGKDRNAAFLSTLISHVLGISTATVAAICCCGLVTLLFMLYFTVRPFSVSAYRRLAAQLGLACILDAFVLLLPTMKIHLTEDSDVPSPVGTSILVCNHLCDGDWWIMFMLGRCVGLQGTMKAMLRNEYLQIDVDKVNGGSGNASRSEADSPSAARGCSPSAEGSKRIVPFSRNEHNSNLIHQHCERASPDLALMARLLHLLLDFPLVSGEDYTADRKNLFRLLRSFATSGGTGVPVHLLSFPEGWCVHNRATTMKDAIRAKSNEFAQKEGRPQLKHLLLPRTRGFTASLDCLRESNPVVYDVTMAKRGNENLLESSEALSVPTIWGTLRQRIPADVYVRVKRYSMEEVLRDSSWLDKKWLEKDRLLSHFARHGSFPAPNTIPDNRYCRHRIFDTWSHSLESSLAALARLLILPCTVPILCILSIPIFWALVSIWFISNLIQRIFPGYDIEQATLSGLYEKKSNGTLDSGMTPGSDGSGENAAGTPFVPATPFASPTAKWFEGLKRE